MTEEKEQQKKKIGILGGTSCSDQAKNYAALLGEKIVSSGNILYTGGVGGIGRAAVLGAKDYLEKERRLDEINDLIVQVRPSWSDETEELKTEQGLIIKKGQDWAERRAILVEMCDCLVSISGGSGTAHEIQLVKESEKPFIAIAGEGASEQASKGMFHQKENNQEEVINELLLR